MTGISGSAISRRTMLVTCLVAGACHHAEGLPPPSTRKPAADMHTHFFNLADLPVKNFITYVIIGKYVIAPQWAEALIDFVTGFAKARAKSAEAEASALGKIGQPDTTPDMEPAEFGRKAADYVETRLSTLSAASDADGGGLVASYDALLRELAAQTGTPIAANDSAMPASSIDPKQVAFTRAARVEDLDDSITAAGGNPIAIIGDVTRTIGWAYLMTRSRASHIDRYLARQASADRQPRAIASLLVDYDYWLDDTPSPGSEMMSQIKVMDMLRVRNAARADIRLFAGVCPLRLAIERVTGKSTTFSHIQTAVAEGKVHGIKLYPPMGFRASGNATLTNSAFDAPPERRISAWDKWLIKTGITTEYSLGTALDAALEEIYAYAATNRIPIIVHAGPGNGAAKDFGIRANPLYWEPVVQRHNIRLSLGHLVNDPKAFTKAVFDKGARCDIWALDAPIRMLDRRQDNPPDVYGDLAYMQELNNPGLCAKFFGALRVAFEPGDPKLERILYGTDWIMYAREAQSDRYLGIVEKGMRVANYSGEQIDNILWANAERFLGPFRL